MKSADQALVLAPSKAITATDTGAAVDVSEFTGNVLLLLNSSAGTGTTPTSTVKLQHSDDGSTNWTDTGFAFDAQAAAASAQAKLYSADRFKKFVRAVNTLGGTTPGYSFGVTMVGTRQNVN